MADKEDTTTTPAPDPEEAVSEEAAVVLPSPQDSVSGETSLETDIGSSQYDSFTPPSLQTDDKAQESTPASKDDGLEEVIPVSPAPQDAPPTLTTTDTTSTPLSHDSNEHPKDVAGENSDGSLSDTAPPGSHYMVTSDPSPESPKQMVVPSIANASDLTQQAPALEPKDSEVPSKTMTSDVAQETEPKNSVVTIQHNVETTQQSRSGWALLSNLSKPMTAVIIMFALGGVATWAYFFSQFLRIPGLEDQVDRLEEEVDELEKQVDELEMEVDRLTIQIDRLSGEVDRLEEENDRFEQLNAALTTANEEFARLITELEESNSAFEEQNMQLNGSVSELQEQNEQLSESNDEFMALNAQLNATNSALSEEVETLTDINANLTAANQALNEQNAALVNETAFLTNLTMELNNTVISLETQVSSLQNENAQLQLLIDDLNTIVSFLEEEAATGNETYEELASFLAEQIVVNRALLLGATENTYLQTLTSWDCNLFDTFAGEPFIDDLDSPIGATSYPAVITEVNSLALDPLCLNLTDFELYLDDQIIQSGAQPPVDTSLNQLVSGVNMYSTAALDYYFPDASDPQGGLTQEDWATAVYDCVNLPNELRFTFQ